MLGLIISLQGLAVIAFFFGAFNASKGLKMFSEDYGAPQGYLMCIGGALTGLSATMFMPIKPMGMITLIKIRFPDKSSVFSRWFLSL